MRPVYSREGEVSGTTTIDPSSVMTTCPWRANIGLRWCRSKTPPWEVMSIRDTDGDEQVDRSTFLRRYVVNREITVPAPVADQFVMSGGVVAEHGTGYQRV